MAVTPGVCMSNVVEEVLGIAAAGMKGSISLHFIDLCSLPFGILHLILCDNHHLLLHSRLMRESAAVAVTRQLSPPQQAVKNMLPLCSSPHNWAPQQPASGLCTCNAVRLALHCCRRGDTAVVPDTETKQDGQGVLQQPRPALGCRSPGSALRPGRVCHCFAGPAQGGEAEHLMPSVPCKALQQDAQSI